MKSRIAALLCCSLALIGEAGAGEKKTPPADLPAPPRPPELKILEDLAGTFEARVKILAEPKAPVESTGLLTRKMILGGNFLQESFKGKFLGKDFAGLGMIGYDSLKKKYFTTWFDNMSSSPALMFGTYDADKKTLTTFGEYVDARGKKTRARDVLRIVSPDEQFFEMYRQADGSPEAKVMEIHYVRTLQGQEHKILLAGLVGTFDAKVKLFTDPKAPPTEETGVMTRKLILGGNFLQESYKGMFFKKEFAGLGIIGFDALKKKYFTTWFDSMSTSALIMQGIYDEETKTLTTFSEETDDKGRKIKARDVLKIVSPDEQVFSMFRQRDAGPEIKVMEITYIRKKSSPVETGK